MKKLAVKRFPEKMMMAAIILSCGFVLHAEPSAQKAKKAGHTLQKHPHAVQKWHYVKESSSLPVSRPYVPAR